ncbi:MAG: hypothetical protein QOH59_385 [Gemmatimonadales bacterium]|nr:hypothetical protein [Gemmatimonadales bacterium]
MTESDERGIALLVAVVALGVIGALVGGIFFAARLEQQSGQNALFAVQAGEAAEAGLSEAVATLDPAALEPLAVGGTPLDLGTFILPGSAGASRQVSRLTQHLFLIRARGIREGAGGSVLATRSVGLLVRLRATPGGEAPGGIARVAERGWVQIY